MSFERLFTLIFFEVYLSIWFDLTSMCLFIILTLLIKRQKKTFKCLVPGPNVPKNLSYIQNVTKIKTRQK